MAYLLTDEAASFLHELLLCRVGMGSSIQSRCRSIRFRVGLLIGVMLWLLIWDFSAWCS